MVQELRIFLSQKFCCVRLDIITSFFCKGMFKNNDND